MIIMEQRCPRCAIRRTARLGASRSLCFNCGLKWGRPASATEAAALRVAPAQTLSYPFSPAELVRLERYRAAIQAGVYTDYGPSAHRTTAPALASGASPPRG
jgi:hypothetical protein